MERERERRRHEPPGPPSGRNPEVDFRGEAAGNETHISSADPAAHLAKIKGKEAKLSYGATSPVENRHGLVVNRELTRATGTAEPIVELLARERARQGGRILTVGADRDYNTNGFVQQARSLKVPQVARKKRCNAIDG
jgi:hypothetical protein